MSTAQPRTADRHLAGAQQILFHNERRACACVSRSALGKVQIGALGMDVAVRLFCYENTVPGRQLLGL